MSFKRILLTAWALLTAAPAWADADTLTVAVVGLPRAGGHPYFLSNLPTIYTFTAIFDALTFVDGKGDVKPWLATAWKQTGDTTWEFDLRPNVVFSNGEKFTADAVVNAVTYLQSPAAVADTIRQELSALKSARALGPLKVEITTSAPDPMLAREVSALRMAAPEAWQRLGPQEYSKNPIGTGPFKVESWTPSRITMSAFKQSWRPPKVERLEIVALPDGAARLQGVLSGSIDIAVSMQTEDKAALEADGHRLQPEQGTGVFAVILNIEKDPRLRDLKVRQALNYAVDRKRIAEVMFHGMMNPASQFTPPNANGYDPELKVLPYDPDKARALLKEAGYEKGFSFVLEAVPGSGVSDGAIFQQIAANLAEVGVKMEVRGIPLTQLSVAMRSKDAFTGSAFAVDYGTAPSLDSLRALKLHSCLNPYPWYCDKEIMPTVERAVSTASMAEREQLTRTVMRRYREQLPAILLWDIVYFDAIRKEIGEVPAVGSWIVYDRITKRR
jgi:peptide/nickel transport system substrate-binding protein